MVEGPPGTGKSQTITNMIAEFLAAGKSVLFVSEKMAALEVVKSRLDPDLGCFCLELHSRKANKKEVVRELERTIAAIPPQPNSFSERFGQVENLRSDLNNYVAVLREPFGRLGRSPFDLFGMKEEALNHFERAGRMMPPIRFSEPEQCDPEAWSIAETRLYDLAEVLRLVRPLSDHPWSGCDPGTVSPSNEAEIRDLIEACEDAVGQFEASVGHLCDCCGVQKPQTLTRVEDTLDGGRLVASSYPVEREVLLSDTWARANPSANRLVEKVKDCHDRRSAVLSRFEERVLDQDIVAILHEYKELSVMFFRFFVGRYRQLKRDIRALYKGRPEKSRDRIIADLERVEKYKQVRDDIQASEETGRTLFGSLWEGEESNPDKLTKFPEWVVKFRRRLTDGVLTDRAIDLVSRGVSQEEIEALIRDTTDAMDRLREQWRRLKERIGIETDPTSFSTLSARLERWREGLPRLQKWAQFRAYRKRCMESLSSPLLEVIDSDTLEPEDIIPCFRGNFADARLHRVFDERPQLRDFIGAVHENRIRQFVRLDRELIGLNRHRVLHRLFQNRPSISGGASPGSEAGILLGEINRQRRHMPIRKLMALAGGLIQKIKPCFMMSPLSIAQFLDPQAARFDVIIFDEASQVRPEDALGALLRGNQVIVMGDTRQLPPTSFFDHIVEGEEEEDEGDTAAPLSEVESILHQCRRSFPVQTLRWHYRSRHESLIAVSNQEFYDNQLLIYPSAIDRAEHIGLQLVHLPDTVYDRGRSAVNRIEAQRVAEEAVKHYRTYSDKSLGIGTFSTRQQQAILDEIELQIRKNPDIEGFFSSSRQEHFFVKNLETIQGDERDVIFISVGYGFDTNHVLHRTFGPLNRDGGERRLNVLITRARERCVVFSNFRASDLSLDGNARFGLRALKTFLDYAENRNLVRSEATVADTDSPFEDSVYDFLRGAGYNIRKQVGCARFRIDLAIEDPAAPGRYLLGIECDGAQYHSSPVARDRDRLRQQILEGLGWRLYRIWSTDWYRNRMESQQRLLEAIRRAEEGNRGETPSRPVVEPDPPESSSCEEESGDIDLDDPEYSVSDYEACTSLGVPTEGDLHNRPIGVLAEAVASVVDVEGPVHVDEVMHRIRELWRYRRTGQRIQRAIERGINHAERERQIRRRGDFLWPVVMDRVSVRRRTGNPPPDIRLICDEEIERAIQLVLRRQFGTFRDDLTAQASRLLGFQAPHETTRSGISRVIEDLIRKGSLERRSNEMIHLAE